MNSIEMLLKNLRNFEKHNVQGMIENTIQVSHDSLKKKYFQIVLITKIKLDRTVRPWSNIMLPRSSAHHKGDKLYWTVNIREEINSCKHGKRDKLEQEKMISKMISVMRSKTNSSMSLEIQTGPPKFLEIHKLVWATSQNIKLVRLGAGTWFLEGIRCGFNILTRKMQTVLKLKIKVLSFEIENFKLTNLFRNFFLDLGLFCYSFFF